MKYYFAYGSNMNLAQMANRCPTAKAVGASQLPNYLLIFNKYATVIPSNGGATPGAVWEIDDDAEKALDFYEGYPTHYRKENVSVIVNNQVVMAMVYIMNRNGYCLPDRYYLEVVTQGYIDIGLDLSSLKEGIERTKALMFDDNLAKEPKNTTSE